jgi:antitoxin component of RelBE/YafQ-DinJ toxin-antitoxin module
MRYEKNGPPADLHPLITISARVPADIANTAKAKAARMAINLTDVIKIALAGFIERDDTVIFGLTPDEKAAITAVREGSNR